MVKNLIQFLISHVLDMEIEKLNGALAVSQKEQFYEWEEKDLLEDWHSTFHPFEQGNTLGTRRKFKITKATTKKASSGHSGGQIRGDFMARLSAGERAFFRLAAQQRQQRRASMTGSRTTRTGVKRASTGSKGGQD